MEDKLTLYQKIAMKLDWDGMLVQVAIPAIDRIVTNHCGHINDCTGDVLCFEDIASSLLEASWTPDDIFSLLVSPDYLTWCNERNEFVALRDEIESYMRKGYSYQDAISEWYK